METTHRLDEKLKELFEVLPLNRAMPSLLGEGNAPGVDIVASIQASPEVMAGLWLYVDDLDRSHTISQGISSPTGAYWHAIMHRREGDFSNSKYWFRQVGDHPVIALLDYDPFKFVDACAADRGQNDERKIEQQRREWEALFNWCRQGDL